MLEFIQKIILSKDELFKRKMSLTINEAKVLIEQWRKKYNQNQ